MSSREPSSGKDSVALGIANVVSDSPNGTREEKSSHDASVFVGSLPCNVDQRELTKMLTEHLSEYAEVKSIKVVRDSKGGICAFVQCESAEAAAKLIESLHAEKPKPFLGRVLRFEPARAFRTLLISYRAPSYTVTEPSVERGNSTQTFHMLDLPTAMRISKSKATRFHNIAYNAAAIEVEYKAKESRPNQEDISLFLHPLQFDEDTIGTMACFFGRVEKFTRFQPSHGQPDGSGEVVHKPYPSPHDSPRTRHMDAGCWEVKWDFRDDCVAALMALRRVPHLSVTWAHQPSYSGWENRYSNCNHHAFQPNYVLPPPFSLASPFEPTYTPFPGAPSPSTQQLRLKVSPTGDEFVGLTESSSSSQEPLAHLPPSPPESYTKDQGNDRTARRSSTNSDRAPSPHTSHKQQPEHQLVGQPPLASKSSSSHSDKGYTYAGADLGEVPPQQTIDPFSLFVGGLEILGPSAWDEEKVRQHFGKYGGLQTVKFVKPFNAVTGFAFLKFDNIDGPAQAVLEEHNRIFNGHLLRVRLRDWNPPRNPWKYGRGRGRLYHHQGPGHQKFDPVDRFNFKFPAQKYDTEHTNEEGAENERPSSQNSQASQTLNDEASLPSPSVSAKSQNTTFIEGEVQEAPERYREWYDDLDASTSPHSLPASPSVAAFPPPYPYVFPGVPYYGPWPQPYMHHQVPYPMPYFNPYPVYPPILHSGHPAGDQDTAPQGWSPPGVQGVVYSSSYYAFPGVVRQPISELDYQTPSSNPNISGAIPVTQGDQTDPVHYTDGLASSGASSTTGLPLGPPLNHRPHSIPFPNQPKGAPRPFAHPSWNGDARAAAPPIHMSRANVPFRQPPFHQVHHTNSFVNDPSFPFHTSRKRQPFKRDSQTNFHANRNTHVRNQNNHVGNVDLKGKGPPPAFI